MDKSDGAETALRTESNADGAGERWKGQRERNGLGLGLKERDSR